MTKIYLYNESLFLPSKIKGYLKNILGLSSGGPANVFKSLVSGLNDLGQSFAINQKADQSIELACVLNGVKTLNWALSQKAKGVIKKIVAGPNIVISPKDFQGILNDPLVDLVIVPSQWVSDAYALEQPNLKPKLFVWAAGVDIPSKSNTVKVNDFLIYNKSQDQLAERVADIIKDKGLSFKQIKYGSIGQSEFFSLLDQSKFMIYLSSSESQGLAMFEAWARDVPTFVWEKGFYEAGEVKIEGNTASPYLTLETGMRFKDLEDFKSKLDSFIFQKFQARDYCQKNYSNAVAARHYMEIIG